jgi:hypothetical protein
LLIEIDTLPAVIFSALGAPPSVHVVKAWPSNELGNAALDGGWENGAAG